MTCFIFALNMNVTENVFLFFPDLFPYFPLNFVISLLFSSTHSHIRVSLESMFPVSRQHWYIYWNISSLYNALEKMLCFFLTNKNSIFSFRYSPFNFFILNVHYVNASNATCNIKIFKLISSNITEKKLCSPACVSFHLCVRIFFEMFIIINT